MQQSGKTLPQFSCNRLETKEEYHFWSCHKEKTIASLTPFIANGGSQTGTSSIVKSLLCLQWKYNETQFQKMVLIRKGTKGWWAVFVLWPLCRSHHVISMKFNNKHTDYIVNCIDIGWCFGEFCIIIVLIQRDNAGYFEVSIVLTFLFKFSLPSWCEIKKKLLNRHKVLYIYWVQCVISIHIQCATIE